MNFLRSFSFLASAADMPGCIHASPELLKKIRGKYALRRSDRYTLLGSACALALRERTENGIDADCALITAAAFGPHRTVFSALDDILDYPEGQMLPSRFSHSVQNAAASYIGTLLGIRGPTVALSGFEDVFFEALFLAETFFRAEFCKDALVLGIGENGLLTDSAALAFPKRFPCGAPEGACALLLSADPAKNRYGTISLERSPGVCDRGLFFFGAERRLPIELMTASEHAKFTIRRLVPPEDGSGKKEKHG